MAWTDRLVLSCEHAGSRVPARYGALFRGSRRLLETHEALDLGALGLARFLARRLARPLHATTVTRLLVDCNRSEHNSRGLFSDLTRGLPREEQERILARHFRPYRDGVEAALRRAARSRRPALHLSVHSFTPRFRGRRRRTDLGILFDPSRTWERRFAHDWQARLREALPGLSIRRNHPYRGTADGFTVHLRRALGRAYVGLEIEVSQRFPLGPPGTWRSVREAVLATFRETCGAAGR